MTDPYLDEVAKCAKIGDLTASLLKQAVAAARGEGKTWKEIGEAIGISHQGVQQRFGRGTSE